MPRSGKKSTHEVYKQCPRARQKERQKPFTWLDKSHFIKSIMDKEWSSKYTLPQFTKVYKKKKVLNLDRIVLFCVIEHSLISFLPQGPH